MSNLRLSPAAACKPAELEQPPRERRCRASVRQRREGRPDSPGPSRATSTHDGRVHPRPRKPMVARTRCERGRTEAAVNGRPLPRPAPQGWLAHDCEQAVPPTSHLSKEPHARTGRPFAPGSGSPARATSRRRRAFSASTGAAPGIVVRQMHASRVVRVIAVSGVPNACSATSPTGSSRRGAPRRERRRCGGMWRRPQRSSARRIHRSDRLVRCRHVPSAVLRHLAVSVRLPVPCLGGGGRGRALRAGRARRRFGSRQPDASGRSVFELRARHPVRRRTRSGSPCHVRGRHRAATPPSRSGSRSESDGRERRRVQWLAPPSCSRE